MKLKQPTNKRLSKTKCCFFCEQYRDDGSGLWHCKRDLEDDDAGDLRQYFTVCDRFKTNSNADVY